MRMGQPRAGSRLAWTPREPLSVRLAPCKTHLDRCSRANEPGLLGAEYPNNAAELCSTWNAQLVDIGVFRIS